MLGRSVLLLGIAMALLVPAAQAQVQPELQFSIVPVPELLAPDTGVTRTKATLLISCSKEDARLSPFNVQFKVHSTAPYAQGILNPSKVAISPEPSKCTDAAYRHQAKTEVMIQTTRAAPAFAVFPTVLEAVIVGDATHGPIRATLNLTNGYLPLIMVNPAALYLKTAQGATFQFPVEIQNLGNGATRITFEIEQHRNSALNLVAPASLDLESRTSGAAARYKMQTVVEGRAPSGELYRNDIHQFTLKVKSTSTDPRGLTTDEQTINFSVQVQGTGSGAPGPSVATFTLALLLGLVVHRYLRRAP